MLYALVDGIRVSAHPYERGLCPLCEQSVIARCGELNVWHWAHKASGDCDAFSESETPWHRNWKRDVSPDYCEVSIERKGVKHRADIITRDGTVLELQHSSISSKDIRRREEFYGDMIWLIDYTENWPNFEFKDLDGRLARFRWLYPRRSFMVAKASIYIHIGENLTEYQEAITWISYYDLEIQGIAVTGIDRRLINSPLPDNDWIFRINEPDQQYGTGEFITVNEFKEQFLVLRENEDFDRFIQTRLK